MMSTVHIHLDNSSPSGPYDYLTNFPHHDPTPNLPQESLLHAIRGALRGPLTQDPSHPNWSTTVPFDSLPGQEEVFWHGRTVILACGNQIKKKWTLSDEGSQIEYVCLGLLKLPGGTKRRQRNSSPYTSDWDEGPSSSTSDSSARPTFGLFTRLRAQKKASESEDEVVPAVFVFLRGMGKIFANNGLEFTFALPFIVRKAWPLYPHGVLIQRSIERAEMHEAEILGEDILPSIFSMTSPFSEALAIGRTRGIVGGYPSTSPVSLVANDADSAKALRSVDPEELVLWVSNTARLPETTDRDDHLILTFNRRRKHRLTLWRYAFVDPQPQKPPPPPQPPSSSNNAIETNNAPLSSLPGMAPFLSSGTTMATMFNGDDFKWPNAPPQHQQPVHTRSGSLNTELSFTLDKMALNTSSLKTPVSDPDSGRMKASLWIQKLTSVEVPDEA
jgi:anaphase-promoting complex subunit 1